MAEIERLSKLDITEIHNWYNSIFEDILLHNQKLLFDKSDTLKESEFVKTQFKNLFYDNTTL